jgi:hypothetical protein
VQKAARLGFEVNVALAANPDAALIAAKGRTGISLVPSGEERKCPVRAAGTRAFTDYGTGRNFRYLGNPHLW